MKNIEIKYRITFVTSLYGYLMTLDEIEKIWTRHQEDTYYHISTGRLKLRKDHVGKAQLIYYIRPDSDQPRACDYSLYPTDQPRILDGLLQKALGKKLVVHKKRTLLMFRNVRVHLDTVEGLGDFLELESVVDDTTNERMARQNLNEILSKLRKYELVSIAGSYADLLLQTVQITNKPGTKTYRKAQLVNIHRK